MERGDRRGVAQVKVEGGGGCSKSRGGGGEGRCGEDSGGDCKGIVRGVLVWEMVA